MIHYFFKLPKVLTNFQERGPPTFPPTFKVERGSPNPQHYQTKRIPSWCDRILWTSNTNRSAHRISCDSFDSVPNSTTSDHKPVRAIFSIQLDAPPQTLHYNTTTNNNIATHSNSKTEAAAVVTHRKMQRSASASILGFFHHPKKTEMTRPPGRMSVPDNGAVTLTTTTTTTTTTNSSTQPTLKRTFSMDQNVVIVSISKLQCQHLPQMDSNCNPFVVIDVLPFEFR